MGESRPGLDTRAVADFCCRWEMLPAGGLVLCAVSGGRDSMALLHLLWTMSGPGGFSVAAAHYNHRLRPTAARDEDFVRAWCRERDIPLTVGRGDVAAFARESGRSLEDAARELRYRFLEETADRLGAARIATAHHRRDNAETVLLHLLRGAGLRGLTGIPPVRGRIVRPLLETDREEIEAYVSAWHIPYVEDETNADPAYTRNRLRLEILPALEEMAPGAAARIARTGELLRAEEEHLEREAAALLPAAEGERISLSAAALNGADLALRRRLVRGMAARLDRELSAAQVEAVLALGAGGVLDLPRRLRAVRRRDALLLYLEQLPAPPVVLLPGEQRWGSYLLQVEERCGPVPEEEGLLVLSRERRPGKLTVAPWNGGGRLAVENGSRTIKRLFSDRGIPTEERAAYPVLYLDGVPAAVPGVAVDRRFLPRPGEKAFAVKWKRDPSGTVR